MHTWIDIYNHSRPHAAPGGTPRTSRIARDDLHGYDSYGGNPD